MKKMYRTLGHASNGPTLLAEGCSSHSLVYAAFLFPALAGLLFGYDIGAASGAVSSLSALTTGNHGEPNALGQSMLTAASLFGAFVGSLLILAVGDDLGRRRELLVGGVLYFLGSLASILPVASAELSLLAGLVIAGRAVYGLGIAFSMHAAPCYISEISPATLRGSLIALKEGFVVGGILLGFAATALCEALVEAENVWRLAWALPLPVSIVIFAGMIAMPPSPRWLLLRGRRCSELSCFASLLLISLQIRHDDLMDAKAQKTSSGRRLRWKRPWRH